MKPGELNHLICKISREHYRRSFAEFTKHSISQGQPRILRYLKDHDGCIQRELCENCHLEPATVTNVLSGMEKAGLVERHPGPEDRRIVRVTLTCKGREALGLVDQVHIQLEEECFADFSPQEREQAASYLKRISENLLRAGG